MIRTPISANRSKRRSILIGCLLLLVAHFSHAESGGWSNDPQLAGVGKDDPLCQNLLKYLNGYQGCPGNVIATFPEFSEPPWKELNPEEHVDLIWQPIMFGGRANRYFQPGAGGQLPAIPDTGDRRAARDFIARGGKVRVWRTRLFDDYGDARYPVPAGEQTIVELSQTFLGPTARDQCGSNTRLWDASSYVVTADLSGPDPRVPGPIAYQLRAGELLTYKGVPYLVMSYGLVNRMQTSARLSGSYPPFHYCGFRFTEKGK